jgi:HEAT repeat protein
MPQTPDPECEDKLVIAIAALIETLGSHDGALRHRGRRALQEIGEPAVPALIDATTHAHHRVRWEATKALGHIGDPQAAAALVQALGDEDSGVRWLAAEGLATLGPPGWEAMLRALVVDPEDVLLRNGTHHVLRSLADTREAEALRPVLESLDAAHSHAEMVTRTHAALQALADTHRADP